MPQACVSGSSPMVRSATYFSLVLILGATTYRLVRLNSAAPELFYVLDAEPSIQNGKSGNLSPEFEINYNRRNSPSNSSRFNSISPRHGKLIFSNFIHRTYLRVWSRYYFHTCNSYTKSSWKINLQGTPRWRPLAGRMILGCRTGAVSKV